MEKSISGFLLKSGLGCGLGFFNMAVGAVQVGDRIEIPVSTLVYLDNESNCKDYTPFTDPSCTIGFGDIVEVLEIQAVTKSGDHVVVLEYFPGDNHWEGKCQLGRNFCFIHEDRLELFRSYSALEPKIETVTESEEPPRELIGDNNSTAIVKGQVFSIFQDYSIRQLHGENSSFSVDSALYAVSRFIGHECHPYYGYRLKVVGFKNHNWAYARLIKPEYEKQVVTHKQFYNCPVGSLFQAYIPDLIKGAVLYRESLKLREDFLKSFISSRFNDTLFDLPLTVDGLTVGQIAWVKPNYQVQSIQNIDFEYLEQWGKNLAHYEHSLQKGFEGVKSFVEGSNPFVFTTIPMMNWWSCNTKGSGIAYFGRIIGFTKIDSGFLGMNYYSGSPGWFAIAEAEILGHPYDILGNPITEFFYCRFFLIPTSALQKE